MYKNKNYFQILQNLVTIKNTVFIGPKLGSKESPGFLEHAVIVLVMKDLKSSYKNHQLYLPDDGGSKHL
jgi:hypothetical protein